MILCTFSWPILAHLAVPPGEGFFFNWGGRDVHIECQTLPGARLFSYTGVEYGWLTEEYKVVSRYIRGVTKSGEKFPVRQIHRKESAVPFTGGTVDPVNYTRVLVSFELESTDVLDDDARFAELKGWVESAVRHFVDLYRMVTQEGDVTTPRLRDTPVVDVLVADDYEFNAEVLGGNFRPYKWVHGWEDAARTSRLKETMPRDGAEALAKLLQAGFKPRVFDRLLLDAKEQAFTRDEYDLAIVIVETAFETFLQERLLAACAVKGITDLTVGRGKGATKMPYREAVERAQVRDCLDYAQELSGRTFKGGAEHNNWFTHAYEKRNQIVHRGARGATFDDVGRAYTAVVAYAELIDKGLT
jgi:hypothetical protein